MQFHSNFKINGQSFTPNTFKKYIEIVCVADEIYLQEIGIFLKHWFDESQIISVKTSGSTGKPKIIRLQKQHMTNSALATGEFFNTKENTKALLCLSANYIAGKMMLVRAMVLGWDLHLVAPSSSPLKEIDNTFDFCAMVPLQVEKSLKKLQQVKQLIIGGAPISTSLLTKLQPLKTQCFATYGMTETITHIAVKPLNKTSNYFQTLPNVTLSQDNRGCLVIAAPKVASNKIVTNDVVKLISDTHFEWLGRFDYVINSGGVKLFPEQIEEKLSKVLSYRFFVAGIDDEILGQKLVLILELSNNLFDEEKQHLQNQINELVALSKFEIPKKIYSVAHFITTPTGKINRRETIKKSI